MAYLDFAQSLDFKKSSNKFLNPLSRELKENKQIAPQANTKAEKTEVVPVVPGVWELSKT